MSHLHGRLKRGEIKIKRECKIAYPTKRAAPRAFYRATGRRRSYWHFTIWRHQGLLGTRAITVGVRGTSTRGCWHGGGKHGVTFLLAFTTVEVHTTPVVDATVTTPAFGWAFRENHEVLGAQACALQQQSHAEATALPQSRAKATDTIVFMESWWGNYASALRTVDNLTTDAPRMYLVMRYMRGGS